MSVVVSFQIVMRASLVRGAVQNKIKEPGPPKSFNLHSGRGQREGVPNFEGDTPSTLDHIDSMYCTATFVTVSLSSTGLYAQASLRCYAMVGRGTLRQVVTDMSCPSQ